MRQSRTVEEGHGEAGVVQGGALGHVQVDQGQLGLLPHDVDGGYHWTACNDRYSVFGLRGQFFVGHFIFVNPPK